MFWKKYKGIIVTIVFLAFWALAYFFVVDRMVAEIENRKNKLQELAATQESQRKRLNELPKLKEDFAKAEAAEKKIYPFLKKDRAVELIQAIENLAEKTGNKVVIEAVPSEAPTKGAAKNPIETIVGALPSKDYVQLRVKVTGSFFGLLKLINKLENGEYYLDIISLQVSRNQNPEEAKPVEATEIRNPFSRTDPTKSVEPEQQEENNQEVISLINLVVYTQN